MSLQFFLDSQSTFQKAMGNNVKDMSLKERSIYMKEHGYFLMEEVMEMFREMPFHKSWKDYSGYTQEQLEKQEQLMKEEVIDSFHFMINLFLALGMDEEEIKKMYLEKNELNYRRQQDSSLGYVQSNQSEATTNE